MPGFTAKSGFTLVEFLVVLTLLAIAIGSSLFFLTSLVRGSNKASIVAETRQNGQTTIGSLERMIRNATVAEPHPTEPNYIKLTIDEGSNRSYLYVKGCVTGGGHGPSGWIGVVQNTSATFPVSSASLTPITNTDPVSGVDISNCAFTVVSASGGSSSPPLVNLNFIVNQGISAPSRQDFLANLEFKTTISLRQYK